MSRSKTSTSVCMKALYAPAPALFTRMSTGPSAATNEETAASTATWSVMSAAATAPFPPAAASTVSSSSLERAIRASRAPRFAARSASDLPMPREAPVMTTTASRQRSALIRNLSPPGSGRLQGQDLDDSSEAHPAAGAQRRYAVPAAATTQLVNQRDEDARSGGGDRVTETDSAAVHVDDRMVEAEDPRARDRHRRERLVDLDELHVLRAYAGTLERARHRNRRREAGPGRLDTSGGPATHDRERRLAVLGGIGLVGDDQRRRPVVQR